MTLNMRLQTALNSNNGEIINVQQQLVFPLTRTNFSDTIDYCLSLVFYAYDNYARPCEACFNFELLLSNFSS